jgi:drug/metabolite transporter (DMT)-like permease
MKKIYVYLAVAIFIVSSTETILKLAGQSFSNGIQLNFLRFLIGGLFLLIPVRMSLKKRNRVLKVQDYGIFSMFGFLFIVVSMTLYQIAIEISTASTVSILFSFNPVFNTIFSYFILKERLTKRNIIAVVVSTLGLLIIISQYVGNTCGGIIFALMSAMVFGLYCTLSKQVSKRYDLDVLAITCYSFLFGAVELTVLMVTSHVDRLTALFKQNAYLNKFVDIPFATGISLSNLHLLLYLGIIVTAGGFALYFIYLKEAGASIASIFFFAKPAVASILASVILGEKISLITMVGIVVIAIGSYLTYRESRDIQKVDVCTIE